MWLSTKDYKTWDIADSKDNFPEEYESPAQGIYIPQPGVVFRNTILSEGFCQGLFRYLPALGYDYLYDDVINIVHIAAIINRAVCDDVEYKMLPNFPRSLYLCMLCQYKFWQERNYVRELGEKIHDKR